VSYASSTHCLMTKYTNHTYCLFKYDDTHAVNHCLFAFATFSLIWYLIVVCTLIRPCPWVSGSWVSGSWVMEDDPLSAAGPRGSPTTCVFSARCNIYISRLCYDVCVRLSVRLFVTEVHWRIIASYKFQSHFTANCGRRPCAARRAACGRIILRHASQC